MIEWADPDEPEPSLCRRLVWWYRYVAVLAATAALVVFVTPIMLLEGLGLGRLSPPRGAGPRDVDAEDR